jgi:hypothetical protein
MVPEMSSSSFLRSARAARGRPQFATYNKVCWERLVESMDEHTGPQK